MLNKHFDMKDLGDASFVLGKIFIRDKTSYVLHLFEKAYLDRILKRFYIYTCSPGSVLVTKGEKLSKNRCLKNENDRIKNERYQLLFYSWELNVCSSLHTT